MIPKAWHQAPAHSGSSRFALPYASTTNWTELGTATGPKDWSRISMDRESNSTEWGDSRGAERERVSTDATSDGGVGLLLLGGPDREAPAGHGWWLRALAPSADLFFSAWALAENGREEEPNKEEGASQGEFVCFGLWCGGPGRARLRWSGTADRTGELARRHVGRPAQALAIWFYMFMHINQLKRPYTTVLLMSCSDGNKLQLCLIERCIDWRLGAWPKKGT